MFSSSWWSWRHNRQMQAPQNSKWYCSRQHTPKHYTPSREREDSRPFFVGVISPVQSSYLATCVQNRLSLRNSSIIESSHTAFLERNRTLSINMKHTRAPELEIPCSNGENRSTRMEGNMCKGVYYSTALVGEKKQPPESPSEESSWQRGEGRRKGQERGQGLRGTKQYE